MDIIHTSDITKVPGCSWDSYDQCSIIILNSRSQKDREILERNKIEELKIDELDDKERISCEREYIENISDLSSRYNSIEWWANPLSEKNEHISTLYNDLCSYYCLIKTLMKYINTDKTIFLICNVDIYRQLKECRDLNNTNIASLDNAILALIKNAGRKLYDLFKISLFLSKAVIQKAYSSYKLNTTIGERLDSNKKYYVIRTWLDSRFLKDAGYSKDPYFGRLPEYIKEQGYNLLVFAGILSDYSKATNLIKNTKGSFIIPEEYFLKYSDLARLIFHCRSGKIKIKERILFNGLDATVLYKSEAARGLNSPDFCKNVLRYYIARRFASSVAFNTFLQPFENYAWEKLTITGLRAGEARGSIFGFQHAFISRNSFKYFPGEKEKNIIPLPDRIISIGNVTKDKMLTYGSYKSEIFSTGCALRQEYLSSITPLRRKRFNKIVVPLTMVKNESLSMMHFLNDSGIAHSGLNIIIRCHPAAAFGSFSKEIDFNIPDNFSIRNKKSVRDELADTDMVLYTWTTVAVEALKMGLPVIYMDILKPMYVDPLFECSALKRSISAPGDLLPVIESIYKMDDESFYEEQQISQKYLEDYFHPVSDAALQSAFI